MADKTGGPSGKGPMIEVQSLTKVYGATRAVDNISFQVNRGEILGFLGPNGAGKTTTMRVLTCYTPATMGRASIGGFDTAAQSEQVRGMIGYMPENAPLYPDMTVRAYLNFMSEIKRHPASKRRKFVDKAIAETGLQEVTNRVIRNLSKGFRQRVGLAQALLGDPPVLILDEPTVGLDPKQIAEIRQLIKSMAGRRTVILSTHILPEVTMTCQRILIINNGRIEAQGTPESLISELGDDTTILATVEGPAKAVEAALGKVAGVQRVTEERSLGPGTLVWRIQVERGADPRPELARAVIEGGHKLLELQSTGLSLEDIFMRVISGPAAAETREVV